MTTLTNERLKRELKVTLKPIDLYTNWYLYLSNDRKNYHSKGFRSIF